VIADSKSISVLRTRLPYVDRRSLSKAWLAALGIADPAATRAAAPPRAFAAVATPSAPARLPAPGAPPPSVSAAPIARREVPAERRTSLPPLAERAPAVERARAARSVTAASRAASARSYPTYQTSFVVGLDGARVQLVLRRERNTLHVVALCAPGDVATVSRALARADAHLRAGGDRVEATVRAVDEVRA